MVAMFTTLQTFSLLAALSGAASAGLAPQQRADICGTKGYDRGNGNYYYDGSGKYSTYAACSALCAADPKCKSFGLGDQECMLFNVALSGDFDADSGSSDTYYDRGCITSGSSPGSSTASTTTSKAETTTQATTTPQTTAATSKTTTSASKQTAAATTLTTINQRVGTSASTSKPTSTSASSSGVKPSSSSTTATSTASSGAPPPAPPPAPSVSIPAECASTVPATLTMTTFSWFNSTHNLDCVSPNYPDDARVCWDSTGAVCADGDPSCTCTPFCYTGIPAAAYQPLGYGPPDTIRVAFAGGGGGGGGGAPGCAAANPQSIRRNELGQGHFDCGSAADIIGFTGDSNKDAGGTGSVYYNAYGSACNGRVPRYAATFPLTCSRDAGNNATCTAPVPLPLTLASL